MRTHLGTMFFNCRSKATGISFKTDAANTQDLLQNSFNRCVFHFRPNQSSYNVPSSIFLLFLTVSSDRNSLRHPNSSKSLGYFYPYLYKSLIGTCYYVSLSAMQLSSTIIPEMLPKDNRRKNK